MPEKWDRHRMDYNSHNGQYLHGHHHHPHPPRNQSFSSALLDAICKSTEVEGGMMVYKKSRSRVETRNVEVRNMRNSRIETQWDEDSWTSNEKFLRGRSAKMGVFNAEDEAVYRKHREFHLCNMSSTTLCSSEYVSNSFAISRPGISSDAESLYKPTSSIRSSKTEQNSHHVGSEERAWKWDVGDRYLHGRASVRDGYFRSLGKPSIPADHHAKIKSKSKTGKDSKKPKQPISPGRKLANFLNSLFTAGDTKKPKFSSSSSVSGPNSYDSSERKPSSVCSSASSIQSRPCLSKTSRGSTNSSGMSQMSVTSYPINVIVDKADSIPFRENFVHRIENPNPSRNPRSYPDTHPFKVVYNLPLSEKDSHAAAKGIIAKYQKANGITKAEVRILDKQKEEEEDDVSSCSSSDLFELENLGDINMNLHPEELPVYGTTYWATNKAIAKGLIM